MSGRPAPATARVEVLKELQQLLDNRDARDRLDRSPIAETKGREHWVLHLLLRAQESGQQHVDTLIGTAYANLLARLQSLEDRLGRLEERSGAGTTDLRERVDVLATTVHDRLQEGIEQGTAHLAEQLGQQLRQSLDEKWQPIGESVETFAVGSRQMLKDVADIYRVATQTRLLLNENARRISDLGRDLLALEESLKLVVQRTLEEGLVPLEGRVSALEGNHPETSAPGRPANATAPGTPGA